MKLVVLSLITALTAGGAFAAHPSVEALDVGQGPRAADPRLPAESWAPRDTADSLWRRGRIAISEESWDRAAEAFRDIVDRFPRSTYAGDALYWEAFALQRIGRQQDIRRAVTALERQKEDFASAATFTSGESAALLTRLKGRLARSGDAGAAVDVATIAEQVGQAVGVAAEVAVRSSQDMVRQMEPMIRASMEGAMRGLEGARIGMGRGESDIPPECEGVISEESVEAINALMQMNGDRALPILRKVLARRDKCSEILRRKAVFLVSQQGDDDQAVDLLVSVAKTDPDRKTREDAVFWLSQTGSERAAEVLETILLDRSADRELQKKAIFSISQSDTPRGRRALRDFVRRSDVDPEVRGDAIFWLSQSGDAESSAMLRELFPTVRDRETQEKILFSLSQQESAANTRFLLDRAKDRTLPTELRKTALFWAGQGGAPLKDLGEVYDSAGDDIELRKQVVFVLSQRDESEAVDRLIAIARKETDRDLRKNAIFWLGQSGDPKALKFIEELINK